MTTAREGSSRSQLPPHTVGSPRRPTSKESALQPLSPREIQARVRAGASPEVVAAETGWPLDKVTRYAEPLLGERTYVAKQAAAVEISRSRGGATLHESVCIRLQVDPDTDLVSWDSYRNPEGRWIVTAFHDGGSVGTWVFDEVGHTVHPQDESARALMGAGPSAVNERAESVAIADVEETTDETTDDAPHPADTIDDDQPSRPRLVSVNSDPTAVPSNPSEPSGPSAPGDFSGDQTELLPADEVPVSASTEAPRREKRSKGKRGRASVPSWDEILFGASKKDD